MQPSCSNVVKRCLQVKVKVKVKVKVVSAKSTQARQLLFCLHRHFLFHTPHSQHTNISEPRALTAQYGLTVFCCSRFQGWHCARALDAD